MRLGSWWINCGQSKCTICKNQDNIARWKIPDLSIILSRPCDTSPATLVRLVIEIPRSTSTLAIVTEGCEPGEHVLNVCSATIARAWLELPERKRTWTSCSALTESTPVLSSSVNKPVGTRWKTSVSSYTIEILPKHHGQLKHVCHPRSDTCAQTSRYKRRARRWKPRAQSKIGFNKILRWDRGYRVKGVVKAVPSRQSRGGGRIYAGNYGAGNTPDTSQRTAHRPIETC